MPLTVLYCDATAVSDLSPLEGMYLTEIQITPKNINKSLDVIRSMKSLRSIGTSYAEKFPPEEFWKKYDAGEFGKPTPTARPVTDFNSLAFQQWVANTQKLPAEQQVEAVSKKLVELNPGFDGNLAGIDYGVNRDVQQTPNPTIENGVVTRLFVFTDNVSDISPIRALQGLERLVCEGSIPEKGQLSDLSPLKGMKLQELTCGLNPMLSSLEPLRGLRLNYFSCYGCPVRDISPLKGMPITLLTISRTLVDDLSAVEGMPLNVLYCQDLQITDLSPLKGMSLHTLWLHGTKVSDFSLLKSMPLKNLWIDFNPDRDTEILRSLNGLEKINYKPAAEFWREVEEKQSGKMPLFFQTPGFEPWAKAVAAMPAEKQVEAVSKKLVELNPGFDGKVTPTIDGGMVTGFVLVTDNVTDISPVRVFPGIRSLSCGGTGGGGSGIALEKGVFSGKLSDLSPLKEMSLTSLTILGTQVSDLMPLKGMPLTMLRADWTQVSDLSPLRGMPLKYLHIAGLQISDLSQLSGLSLTELNCGRNPISDLSPLKGMPIEHLELDATIVTDLTPLKGMPLRFLNIGKDVGTHVTDLSLLKELPIQQLWLYFKPGRDTAMLRTIKTLETINGKPAIEFCEAIEAYNAVAKMPLAFKTAGFDQWVKQTFELSAEEQVKVVAAKLQELNPGFDGQLMPTIENGVVISLEFLTSNVTDISPVRAFVELKSLNLSGGQLPGTLSDLSPLTGMPLTYLALIKNPVSDLTPLRGMKLTGLLCAEANITEISALEGMPLTYLALNKNPVTDLSPLKGMSLSFVSLRFTLVSDLSPIQGMPLKLLYCSYTRVSDLSLVKNMPLKEIWLDFKVERDTELLRSIQTLEIINRIPVAEFWKKVEEKRLVNEL